MNCTHHRGKFTLQQLNPKLELHLRLRQLQTLAIHRHIVSIRSSHQSIHILRGKMQPMK